MKVTEGDLIMSIDNISNKPFLKIGLTKFRLNSDDNKEEFFKANLPEELEYFQQHGTNKPDDTLSSIEFILLNTLSEDEKIALTVEILNKQLESSYESFGERIDKDGNFTNRDEEGNLMNGQLQKDAWSGDVADFFGKIWGDNNADDVRAD